MSKIILLASFFALTPFLLIFTILYLSFLRLHNGQLYSFGPSQKVIYAALPTTREELVTDYVLSDARIEKLEEFFSKHKSPLEPFATDVIKAADEYGLDFRLLPAIAMQESNLCKKAPIDSYNCWGYGIYGKNVRTFSGYKEGIDVVTKTLAKSYKENGLHTPEEIAKRYTPSDTGKWVSSVTYFMNNLSLTP